MPTIIELIEDYQEGDFLDFKKEEYGRSKKHELIKDVLAFANSEHVGDKFIIIGLKKTGEELDFFDIEHPEDSSNIQSIIHDNIKPDLNIDYNPYTYQSSKLVILTIKNPTDKPYSTKKIVANPTGGVALAENSFKIRKGSRIKDISRDDLDKIYFTKINQKPDLKGKVTITFRQTNTDSLQLAAIGDYTLPSEIELERLQEKIAVAVNDLENWKNSTIKTSYSITQRILSPEQRLESLQLEQQMVKNTFAGKDKYKLFEELGHKIQFTIHNTGDFTLQKSTALIEIQNYDGLEIADQIYSPDGNDYDRWYPQVKRKKDTGYSITADVSEIKHKLPHELLHRPLRMFFADTLRGQTIVINITLHAENYHDVLTFKKYIEVV